MTRDDSGHFDPAQLERWWQATLGYMQTTPTSDVGAGDSPDSTSRPIAIEASSDCAELNVPRRSVFGIDSAWPHSNMASHGRQRRLISRVRGSLLWFTNSAAQGERDPLLELEHVFHLQIAFIARHPQIPARLLGRRAHHDSAHIRRRVQKLIDLHVSRFARVIERARHQGLFAAETDSHAAACLLIGQVQGLAIGLDLRRDRADIVLARASSTFAAFRAQLIGPN